MKAMALAGKIVTHAQLEKAFKESAPEREFAIQIRAAKLPEPAREHRFHPDRRWRLDFAWIAQKAAIEVEGAIWTGGRHTSGKGFTADCEKYSEALLLGWRVIRVPAGWVKSGKALELAKRMLGDG